MAFIHIYGARVIFNYFVITKTLNMSHAKYKQAYINQDLKITKYQTLYGRTISILQKMVENIVVVIHVY